MNQYVHHGIGVEHYHLFNIKSKRFFFLDKKLETIFQCFHDTVHKK